MLRIRAAALALLVGAGIALPASSAEERAASALPERYQEFLEEVAPLLSDAERQAFLALDRDYRRDAFITAFWKVRDPHPETGRNELEETWKERVKQARERFGSLEGERARVFLLAGPPLSSVEAACGDLLRPLEIWFYSRAERFKQSFSVVFISQGGLRSGPFRLWYPSQGFAPLLAFGGELLGNPQEMFNQIEDRCVRGSDVVAGLSAAVDWSLVEKGGGLVPRPGGEWLAAFSAASTEVPEGAESFPAELAVNYPGRYQSRTVVQGVVLVPAAETAASRHFLLDGEVLRGAELFEHFRYRFAVRPEDAVAGKLPLVFQRHLRAGGYRLVLKVEDLERKAFFRAEYGLEVPDAEALAARQVEAAPASPPSEPTALAKAAADPVAEANQDLRPDDASILLLKLPPRILSGRVRFDAQATGKAVSRVRFELDGKPVLTKAGEPYSAELDLGASPRLHRLRAVALDAAGKELATDELIVNGGPHRFGVRFLDPVAGRSYGASVPVRAVVDLPEGEKLDRLEIYLNEDLVTTLYQAPFVQPVRLAKPGELAYVRAVAYLDNGAQAENAVVINAPASQEEVSVQLVELYTTVTDRRGRPVDGLEASAFRVFEDKVEQTVRRFERVSDQPIHVVVLLDTSTSMVEELADAEKAAQQFFSTVLTPRDRGAVITFNERPSLAARFTADQDLLADGLAGLKADGETALYDALVYGLFYCSGIPGKRALVLLSDGEDVASRYGYEDVVEYARRTGVAIYPIGLGLKSSQADIRIKLSRLASETGGLTFYIDTVGELERVYKSIEAELRSQYLVAYQSSNSAVDRRFREVEVRMKDGSLTAKTLRGYYP